MALAILAIIAGLQLASAQFGQFGQGGGGGSCDFRRLSQVIQQQEQCMDQLFTLKKEAMRAIQRLDPSCNAGMVEAFEKCEPAFKNFKDQNGLSDSAMFECCFPGRSGGGTGGFNTRGGGGSQCDFKNKPLPKDEKDHGKGKDVVGGSASTDAGAPDSKARAKQAMATLGSIVFDDVADFEEHFVAMGYCKNEDRPISQNAITGAYRQYVDRLTAKLWECQTPFIQAATNCTDIQYQDLECLEKGYSFQEGFVMDCVMACMPSGLSSRCNMFTGGQQGNNMMMNNNSQMNNRNNNYNNNNNNNNNMFDPFGK